MESRSREPTKPGVILKTLYLEPLGVSVSEFAEQIGVSRKTVSAIINGRGRVTPEMAVRFACALPPSSADLWLNLQRACDLYHAFRAVPCAAIRPLVPEAVRA